MTNGWTAECLYADGHQHWVQSHINPKMRGIKLDGVRPIEIVFYGNPDEETVMQARRSVRLPDGQVQVMNAKGETMSHEPTQDQLVAAVGCVAEHSLAEGTIITSDLLFHSSIAAVRSEESAPRYYRQVQYPDGRIELQGGYVFGSTTEQGIKWKALPLVQVSEQGEEL